MKMKTKKIPPVHPGEILKDEVLDGMAMTQNALAVAIKVPPRRINEIVLGKRSITADTALRLATFLRMPPEFWLGLQMKYDLAVQEDKAAAKNSQRDSPGANQSCSGVCMSVFQSDACFCEKTKKRTL